jgi:hypothetical protein
MTSDEIIFNLKLKADADASVKSAFDSVQRSTKEVLKQAKEFRKEQIKAWNFKDIDKVVKLQDQYKENAAKLLTIHKHIAEKIEKINKLESDKTITKEQARRARSKQVDVIKIAKLEAQTTEKNLAFEKKGLEKHQKSILKRNKAIQGDVKGVVGGVFSKDMAGISDVIAKRMGKGLSNIGVRASEKFAGTEGIGSLLKTIGPSIMAIGALVAGFAALVKIIIDADAQTKELNKTLLDSGVAANDLGKRYEGVGESLNKISRGFAEAFNFNRIWGTTAKDHIQILGAYADANISFRKIATESKRGASEIENLKEATQSALTYTKLLGVSTGDLAGATSDYMNELGMTLQGVNERFSEIAMAAQQSNFSTKKFFGIVMQATAGMGQYNTRIEETVGLLSNLSKIVGKKKAEEMTQSLSKGFKGLNYTDLVKKALMSGGGNLGNIMGIISADVTANVNEMLRKLKAQPEDKAKLFWDALGKIGITKETSTDDVIKKLGSQSEKQIADLMLTLKGTDDELVRSIKASWNVAQGKTIGGLAGASRNLQAMGPIGTLLVEANALWAANKKSLQNMNVNSDQALAEMIGFQNTLGKSTEEIMAMKSALSDIAASFERLKKQTDPDAYNQNTELVNQLGIFMDKEGNWIKAFKDKFGDYSLDESIKQNVKVDKDFNSFAMAWGTAQTADKEQISKDLELAQEVARNTSEMTKLLEQGVQWILSKIDTNVAKIANILGFGENEEKEAKDEAITNIGKEIESLNARNAALDSEILNLTGQLKKAKPGQKQEIQDKIDAARKSKNVNQNLIQTRRSIRDTVASSTLKKGVTTAEDVVYTEGAAQLQKALIDKVGMEKVEKYEAQIKAAGKDAIKDYDKGQVGYSQEYAEYADKLANEAEKKARLDIYKQEGIIGDATSSIDEKTPDKAEKARRDKLINDDLAAKLERDRKRADVMSLLGKNNVSYEDALSVVDDIIAGLPVDTSKLNSSAADAVNKSGLAPTISTQDALFVERNGRIQPYRFAAGDILAAMQPGTGGRGGTTTNNPTYVLHVYNGGADALRILQKAKDAGILNTP